jgi:hypothetical protein
MYDRFQKLGLLAYIFLVSCKKKDVAITIDTATASGSNTGQILPPFTTLMREPMSTQAVSFDCEQWV